MNHFTKDIETLLSILHHWHPISSSFRTLLSRHLRHQYVRPKQELSQEGAHVNQIWYSIDCWTIAYHTLDNGEEEVISIYPPQSIFTEPHSFLQHQASKQRLMILEGNALLYISRDAFRQLHELPETQHLLIHSLLLDYQETQWRFNLMAMNERDKIKAFASRYPINRLPGNIAASFLRMTQAHYSTEKANYNRNS